MQNVATSVRIPSDANDILSSLAAKMGRSKAHVVEVALKQLEEKVFWTEVNEAFQRSAADPVETANQKAEIGLWEQASAKDFKDEQW